MDTLCEHLSAGSRSRHGGLRLWQVAFHWQHVRVNTPNHTLPRADAWSSSVGRLEHADPNGAKPGQTRALPVISMDHHPKEMILGSVAKKEKIYDIQNAHQTSQITLRGSPGGELCTVYKCTDSI